MRAPALRPAALLVALLLALSPAAGVSAQAREAPRDTVALWLDSLAHDPNGIPLSRSDVHAGSQTVAAGEKTAGSIAAWHGNLDVRGVVNGNAVAIGGNVILHPGSVVRGDAVAIGGEVRNTGGTVIGETRTLSALTVGAPPGGMHGSPARTARRSISLSVGWYLVLAVIGSAVALFARGKIETIAERIREDFSRSFLYGVLGQIALVPALVAIVVALAITLIGIILIPFAIVGFALAAAGALALGFLSMCFITGDAVMRWRGAAAPYGPPPTLQFLLIGLSLFLVLWVIGGALAWAGIVGGFIRFLIGVVTWAAVTVGFGATLASRGGTRASTRPGAPPELPMEDEQAWQTPTPVTGVAAARRPTPVSRPRES
jgi:hypothetical protein